MSDVYEEAVSLHKQKRGKIFLESKVKVESKDDLSLVYTPGVAQVSREIAKDKNKSYELSWRGETVAVVSDGSAVLGLGKIGPEAALPVMEGKSLLMQRFAGISSVPIVTRASSEDELVEFVRQISPSFGAINLEDIAAPICFAVEDRLQDLGIPVFHDDQHGTAVVVAAAVRNAAKVVGKKYEELTVVISGAGAAGIGIAQLLLALDRQAGQFSVKEGLSRVQEVVLVDSKGMIYEGRESLDQYKEALSKVSNRMRKVGGLEEAMRGADVFIGVSKGGIVTKKMVGGMAEGAIVLAMANPEPEIMPELAKQGGAMVVGTGRSDYPNQINNSLAFPGIFKGALEAKATKITMGMQIVASDVLAQMIEPSEEKILPDMFELGLAEKIAEAVAKQAEVEGVVRK